MSPQTKAAVEAISLPSFRDGVAIHVRPLNFGGVKVMLSAQKQGPGDMVSVMLRETLKREFPDVSEDEIDMLESEDFVQLLRLSTEANKGLSEMGFTPPTSTED